MFRLFRRKEEKEERASFDETLYKPVLRCSICNGEQVAGFRNLKTGEFREEGFICTPQELEAFKRKYGITELTREY